MSPNDADGMANSVDPDQTLGAVWSGSALFAQACLSENLGSLRYWQLNPRKRESDCRNYFMISLHKSYNGRAGGSNSRLLDTLSTVLVSPDWLDSVPSKFSIIYKVLVSVETEKKKKKKICKNQNITLSNE